MNLDYLAESYDQDDIDVAYILIIQSMQEGTNFAENWYNMLVRNTFIAHLLVN